MVRAHHLVTRSDFARPKPRSHSDSRRIYLVAKVGLLYSHHFGPRNFRGGCISESGTNLELARTALLSFPHTMLYNVLTWTAAAAAAFHGAALPARGGSRVAASSFMSLEVNPSESPSRRALLQQGCTAAGAASLSSLVAPAMPAVAATVAKDWQVVNLPIISETPPILFDIEFDSKDPNLGWIVGNRGTFLQTNDGGKTWAAKSFANLDPDEEINYRFTKVSFARSRASILPARAGSREWVARIICTGLPL